MAKKKLGGLGKGLDSLFADLSDDTGERSRPARRCRCGKSSRTPSSPASGLTRTR